MREGVRVRRRPVPVEGVAALPSLWPQEERMQGANLHPRAHPTRPDIYPCGGRRGGPVWGLSGAEGGEEASEGEEGPTASLRRPGFFLVGARRDSVGVGV